MPDTTTRTTNSARFWVVTGVSILVLAWVGVITWVVLQPAPLCDGKPCALPKLAAGVDISLLLTPVIAAAAGIERLLESVFDYFETRLRWIVAFLADRVEWLHWAQKEADTMHQALSVAATQAQELNPLTEAGQKAREALAVLAGQVEEAEKRLGQVVHFVEYKNYKRSFAVAISLYLGVLVATVGQLRLFFTLGIPIESRVDMILTGLIIGTGSTPVHSLIGILQQTKDTLDGAQSYLNARADATRSGQS